MCMIGFYSLGASRQTGIHLSLQVAGLLIVFNFVVIKYIIHLLKKSYPPGKLDVISVHT